MPSLTASSLASTMCMRCHSFAGVAALDPGIAPRGCSISSSATILRPCQVARTPGISSLRVCAALRHEILCCLHVEPLPQNLHRRRRRHDHRPLDHGVLADFVRRMDPPPRWLAARFSSSRAFPPVPPVTPQGPHAPPLRASEPKIHQRCWTGRRPLRAADVTAVEKAGAGEHSPLSEDQPRRLRSASCSCARHGITIVAECAEHRNRSATAVPTPWPPLALATTEPCPWTPPCRSRKPLARRW